jgi:hypothetical protein
MNPAMLALGIQATLRAAQAGADLYAEHARDRKVFLPNLELPDGSRSEQLFRFLTENPQLVDRHTELSGIWDAAHKELTTTNAEAVDAAYAVMLTHKAKLELVAGGRQENDARNEAGMLAAGRMVEQWREERRPPSALIRMALTLTDIGLEFVAADPSILGVGSRGEKLIAAFALNMSALIPDDAKAFGARSDFADRVLGIFLRAGLGTLADNDGTVFQDRDLARLLSGVTAPIVAALPESIDSQIVYRDLVDTLAGPAAEAAFKLLAENTQTYLGSHFRDDKALGAVTSALFREIQATAHDGGIVGIFSQDGLIRLYKAGLRVAMERPDLILGTDADRPAALFRELLSGAAAILQAHPRFEGPLGASLAAMAVETVGRSAPALLKLNPDEPWERVAAAALGQIVTGLSKALNDLDAHGSPRGALKAFGDGQLLELGRLVLQQAARTPGMLGISRTEVQSIVSGMAEAMAADDNLLVSTDEWLQVAAVAARNAAADPGRLFGLAADDSAGALAVPVLRSILTTAAEVWSQNGRAGKPLLFGQTLATVLAATLDALGGNIVALANARDLIKQFLQALLEKATENPAQFGSQTFLKIFKAFISTVLATGVLPTDNEIDEIIKAGEV